MFLISWSCLIANNGNLFWKIEHTVYGCQRVNTWIQLLLMQMRIRYGRYSKNSRVSRFPHDNKSGFFFHFRVGYSCPYGYNPADFLIKSLAVTTNDELGSRRRLKRICDEFSVSDFAKEVDLEINYQAHVGTYDVSSEFHLSMFEEFGVFQFSTRDRYISNLSFRRLLFLWPRSHTKEILSWNNNGSSHELKS